MVAWTTLGLTLFGLTVQAVVLPVRVLACSCAVDLIPSLVETRADPDAAVFTGQAGIQVGGRVPITVERWFHGPGEADVVWVRARDIPTGPNSVMTNTCGLEMMAGARRFFVVYGTPPEPFNASTCSLGAPLDSPEGQQLVADASVVFGIHPAPVPSAAEPESAPIGSPSAIGEGLLWAAGAFGVGLLFFALIVLIARRRPSV